MITNANLFYIQGKNYGSGINERVDFVPEKDETFQQPSETVQPHEQPDGKIQPTMQSADSVAEPLI